MVTPGSLVDKNTRLDTAERGDEELECGGERRGFWGGKGGGVVVWWDIEGIALGILDVVKTGVAIEASGAITAVLIAMTGMVKDLRSGSSNDAKSSSNISRMPFPIRRSTRASIANALLAAA